jgi:Glycosyltransferase family 87
LTNDPLVTGAADVQGGEHSRATSRSFDTVANFLIPICVFAIALLAYWPNIRNGHADFRNLYTAGYMVRTGNRDLIYNFDATKSFQNTVVSKWDVTLPYIRPAFQALFFAPFSYLSYRNAFFAFFVMNLALILLSNHLLHRSLPGLERFRFFPAAMSLYFPIILALLQGQDSILLMTLLAGAAMSIGKGRESLAGFLVALGLFKFQFVLPIFVLFVAWRRWCFAAAFACTAMFLIALSLWITGLAASIEYFQLMIGVGTALKVGSGLPLNMGLMANIHGAISVILRDSSLVMPVTLATSAALMIFSALKRPQKDQALYVAISVGALVSFYMYVHDMSVLLIPIAAAIASYQMKGERQDKRMTVLNIIAILLWATPIFGTFVKIPTWIVSVPLLFAFTVISTLFWAAPSKDESSLSAA